MWQCLVNKFIEGKHFDKALALRPIIERIRITKPDRALREQGADHEQLVAVSHVSTKRMESRLRNRDH